MKALVPLDEESPMLKTLSLVVLFLSIPAFSDLQSDAEALYRELTDRPATKTALTKKERQEIFNEVSRHRVASLAQLDKYDPTGEIGFCFGRAMATHLIARKHGLAEESVRKLFVIGDLRQSENPEWRFHVTTLVRGEEGGWFAIDPIMEFPIAPGTPLPMDRWMQIVEKVWDKKKQAKFYEVTPKTVLPDLREVPDVDKENGNFIIEIRFQPTKDKGFARAMVGERLYYVPSDVSEADYFMQVGEKRVDTFLFEALKINGQLYHFNGYFFDLLGDLVPHVTF
jgi:hypothetical protein